MPQKNNRSQIKTNKTVHFHYYNFKCNLWQLKSCSPLHDDNLSSTSSSLACRKDWPRVPVDGSMGLTFGACNARTHHRWHSIACVLVWRWVYIGIGWWRSLVVSVDGGSRILGGFSHSAGIARTTASHTIHSIRGIAPANMNERTLRPLPFIQPASPARHIGNISLGIGPLQSGATAPIGFGMKKWKALSTP